MTWAAYKAKIDEAEAAVSKAISELPFEDQNSDQANELLRVLHVLRSIQAGRTTREELVPSHWQVTWRPSKGARNG